MGMIILQGPVADIHHTRAQVKPPLTFALLVIAFLSEIGVILVHLVEKFHLVALDRDQVCLLVAATQMIRCIQTPLEHSIEDIVRCLGGDDL